MKFADSVRKRVSDMETLGGYVARDGVLQRIDPRIKIVALFAVSIGIFTISTWWAMGVYALVLTVVVVLSGMRLRTLGMGLVPVTMIVVVMVLFNSFGVGEGIEPLVGPVGFRSEGFEMSVFFAIRIALLVITSLVLTTTTSVTELTDALSAFLEPLRRFGVPVDDIAMMVSVALRFIPLIYGEVMSVRDAQRARGASFSRGSVFTRLKAWIPVLIPVFVKVFLRSDRLGRAMDARGYGIGPRTRTGMRTLYVSEMVGIVTFVGAVVALGIFG